LKYHGWKKVFPEVLRETAIAINIFNLISLEALSPHYIPSVFGDLWFDRP
jgi:hypothetical protein